MNIENVKAYRFAPIEHQLTWRGSIPYALGLGWFDPVDSSGLQFVYEKDLKAVPSMACVLGYPGFWLRDPELGVDWVRLLHGEHSYERSFIRCPSKA